MKNTVSFIIAIMSLVLLLSLYSSCSKVQEKIEQMKPEIRGVTLEWGAVTTETTEVLGTINVYNPNSITLPVKKVSCNINMNGIDMGNAETLDLQIEKNAEFPIKISAKIDNAKIPIFWAEHLKRKEKSEALIGINIIFDLKVGDFTFPFKMKRPLETDLLSSLENVGPIPVEKKVRLPLVGERTVFKISLEELSGEWGTITPESTQINLVANIHNENPYPLVVPKMHYTIEMNDIMLGSGESEISFTFVPKSKDKINAIVTLNTSLMDKWFVTHIRQGEKSTFDLRVSLDFELINEISKLLGQDRLSITVWEGSENIETDILGNIK